MPSLFSPHPKQGTAGGANCWPLLGIKGSKQVSDRLLGIMFPAECDGPSPSTAPASSTPSAGFEGGLANSTSATCCTICATLGAACSAWVLDSSGTCFPLTKAAGSVPKPGASWARKRAASKWLAAGVQGEIAYLPPRFTSKWLLAGSATGLNDAVFKYGAALKDAAPGGGAKLKKEADPLRNLMTYWS